MIITDNKKAQNFGRSGLIGVITKEVNNMNSLALSFNEVNFSPVQQNGQVWLKTSELAEALGYSDQSGVTRIYSRNEDEFTQGMSCSVKLTEKGQMREVRVFSLRGCHLIAMFSKTAIAKQFRKWVLDILDKEVGVPVAKTTKVERTPLHDAHAMLVAKTKHLNSSDAWKIINQRFGTKSIEEIPYDAIPVAVEYVHHLIALYSNAEKQTVAPWHNKDVQFVMHYLPMLHKLIKNEIFPALKAIQSSYAGQILGLSEEVVVHANTLNSQAIEHGVARLEHVGNQPVHTMEWYLKS